jgi:signal transduction histidine kinase
LLGSSEAAYDYDMIRYLKQISEWGVRPENSIDQIRRIRLTNVILLCLVFASIVQTLLLYFNGAIEAGHLNLAAPFVFLTGLWLMKSGHTTFARLFVLSITYVAGYALSAAMGPDSYIQLLFVVFAAFAVTFLSIDEVWLLAYGLMMPLLCIGILEFNEYQPVFGMKRAQLSPDGIFISRMGSITILWSILTATFVYLLLDRRKSQEQLVSTAKMVATARMAAGIAHEVNNPLQIIVSQADKIRNFTNSSDEDYEKIEIAAKRIQVVAMRIASINKGLLAISRDAARDPIVEVPVRRVIGLALDLSVAHFESQHVDIRTREFSSHWTVRGRETQLAQVILNLLANAYDAVLEIENRWIHIEVRAEANTIEISIVDSGSGLDAQACKRIFEPFFTTKPVGKGTGLGLSVSQGIVSDHGGELFYDSTAENTRFVIRLPRGRDVASID